MNDESSHTRVIALLKIGITKPSTDRSFAAALGEAHELLCPSALAAAALYILEGGSRLAKSDKWSGYSSY